jgi:hypothetical protein
MAGAFPICAKALGAAARRLSAHAAPGSRHSCRVGKRRQLRCTGRRSAQHAATMRVVTSQRLRPALRTSVRRKSPRHWRCARRATPRSHDPRWTLGHVSPRAALGAIGGTLRRRSVDVRGCSGTFRVSRHVCLHTVFRNDVFVAANRGTCNLVLQSSIRGGMVPNDPHDDDPHGEGLQAPRNEQSHQPTKPSDEQYGVSQSVDWRAMPRRD